MKYSSACLVIALVTVAGCSDSSDSPPPAEPLAERYVLGSPDSIPEGVAFDPVERVFYATSLQGGSITRVEADGAESLFRQADGRAQLAGVKVDANARRLWVCARNVDGLDNRVWVFDLDSAELVQEFFLGALASGGSCNDLTLDAAGAAYVSDSTNPFIYYLDPLTGDGSVLATDPLFEDVTGLGVGLNGLVVTPDQRALIVAKSIPSQLFKISLPDGDDISVIATSGDAIASILPDTPLGDVPFGGDGLALLDGDLYVVTPSAVSRVRLDNEFSTGQVVTLAQTDGIGLSTATVAENALYVIKSEVGSLVLGRPLELPFEILRVDLQQYDQ